MRRLSLLTYHLLYRNTCKCFFIVWLVQWEWLCAKFSTSSQRHGGSLCRAQGEPLDPLQGSVRPGDWMSRVRRFIIVCRGFTLSHTQNFAPYDTSRHSRLRLFHHCCVFAHHVNKMPLRWMREDVKTQNCSHLPSSGPGVRFPSLP